MVDTPGGATAIGIPQTGMRVTVASPSVSYCVHMVFRTEHWRSNLNRYNVRKHRMDYYTGNAGFEVEPTILTTVKLRPRDTT